jgi:hypothetical protein
MALIIFAGVVVVVVFLYASTMVVMDKTEDEESFENAAQYAREAVMSDRVGNLEDRVTKLENKKNAKK